MQNTQHTSATIAINGYGSNFQGDPHNQWYIGPLNSSSPYLYVADTAPTPDLIVHEWKVWDGAKWQNATRVKASAQPVTVAVEGTPPFHADLMGHYVIQPANATERPAYYSSENNMWLWFRFQAHSYHQWYIGALHSTSPMFYVADVAPTPDLIKGKWMVWNSSNWTAAPDVRVTVLPRQG